MSKWLLIPLFATASVGLLAESLADNQVRDPTTPLGHAADFSVARKEPEWMLDSVLIGANRKLAIINGQTFREGQLLPGTGEIKVQRILPQTVVLQQGGKTWVLNMSPSILKKH